MTTLPSFRRLVATLALALVSIPCTTLLSQAAPARPPEEQVTELIKTFLAKDFVPDWDGLKRLPGVTWAPQVTSLENCLPDGGCYTLQGRATIAGRNLTVVATGARTIVSYVYLRNGSAPFGEARLLQALEQAELAPGLARCPLPGKPAGTNWYRLKNAVLNAGILSIQTSCRGRPCEGLVLSLGEELPALQPAQLSLYSEQCTAGAERIAVSNLKPHERLAEVVVAVLASTSGPALHDWSSLAGLATDIAWNEGPPKPMNLSYMDDKDTNPVALTGSVTYAQRKFSVIASGTPSQVKNIYFDEQGMHPRGEHMLGVVYEKGITVQLVRCGPVYTSSTNNWYNLKSARTRPAMIRQSIRYEGNQVQDSYAIRLDGTLPPRDQRDRNPGVNGCQ
jgi:hypothetical protein